MNYDRLSKKIINFGLKYHCNICSSWVKDMDAAGGKEKFFQENSVIGAGYRQNVICPVCGNTDRTRFMDFCIRKYTQIYKTESSVLHFAPEAGIREKIKKNIKCRYISGDILRERADCIVNIENICFEDNHFDWIICNYVLQYVDDKRAIDEMKRVLKPAGKMIISMPIGQNMDETIEFVPAKNIGKSAYKRFYGMDIKKRLERLSGMNVRSIRCKTDKFNKYGLMNKDTVFLLEQNK